MSVRILIDLYRTYDGAGTYHVEKQLDYIRACRAIDQALSRDERVDIALHNRAMQRWFDHYRGHNRIAIVVCDPCRMLARELNVSIQDLPIELRQDPQVIVSQELLARARERPIKNGESVLSWMLTNCLGKVWAEELLHESSQVASVISELASGQVSRSIHPTILALRNRRIDSWRSTSQYAQIIQWLFDGAAQKRAESVMLCRLIWKYPQEVRLRALQFEGRWSELSALADLPAVMEMVALEMCAGLPIPSGYARTVYDFISDTLRDSSITTSSRFLSGCLVEEERALRNYLLDNLNIIDDSWSPALRDIARLFAASTKFEPFVNFVRRLQPVPPPTRLMPDDPWAATQQWLEENYFPFFSWCSTVGRLWDTDASVREFEEWLLVNYDALTRTEAFAPYAAREILRTLSADSAILFVVVDGLPWIHVRHLEYLLSQLGLEHIDTSSHITTIPSTTSVAKPSLVRGQLPGQIQSEDYAGLNYGDLFATALGVSQTDLHYATSFDTALVDIVQTHKKAYLYLFNEIDQLIHQPLSQETRHSRIQQVLAGLVRDIHSAKQEFENTFREELVIVIASDHGFTEIPRDAPLVKLPADHDCDVSHGRLIRLTDCSPLPLQNVVEVTPQMLGGAECTFAIPRGYSCVDSKPRGAAHGGLTPQEVVVPILVMGSSIQDLAFEEIELAIMGEIRRGRAENPVSIKIVNGNRVPIVVRDVNIRLVSTTTHMPLRIEPNYSAELEATLDCSNVRQKLVHITGTLAIDFRGAGITEEISLLVETIGAATVDQSFEDDFDV